MKQRIVKELQKRIEEAKKDYKCAIDLQMKKSVLDTSISADYVGHDILYISFPTKFDMEFAPHYKHTYNVAEYSEADSRRFETLEDVAQFIIDTYC
jgi:hypothetical protein